MKNGSNDGGKNSFYIIDRNMIYNIIDLTIYLKLTTKDIVDLYKAFDLLDIPYTPLKTFPKWVEDVDTLCEYYGCNFYFGNILKTMFIHLGDRHSGTNKERELKKREWYLNRLEQQKRRQNA